MTVSSSGGASLDFGDDRLEVLALPTSSPDLTGEVLHKGELVVPSIHLSAGQQLRLDSHSLRVTGDITLDGTGTQLQLSSLGKIKVAGNVTITGGARLENRSASGARQEVYPLALEVTGNVVVGTGSFIDVSGRGYLNDNWSGPDYASTSRGSCHGGKRYSRSDDCTYGRYEHAQFAGSAGQYYTTNKEGYGGGIVSIEAQVLQLDGGILANGRAGGNNSTTGGGAGGSVHLDVSSLLGAGYVQANGGDHAYSTSYPAGAGGRVSVYVEDRSGFSGSLNAHTGGYGRASGAGTVYIKDSADSYGHLRVDNAGRGAQSGSTPVRSVGRHVIAGINQLGTNEQGVLIWEVTVSDTPWMATDKALGWGVDGIGVDLDAADASGSVYVIEENTAYSLVLHTNDDLSGYVGKELVGVHTFMTVSSSGGASLDFGDDRVVALDPTLSEVEFSSSLYVGNINTELSLELGAVVASGVEGNALLFANNNEYIQLAKTTEYSSLSNITYSAWVKPATNTPDADMEIIGNGNNGGFSLKINTDGTAACLYYIDGSYRIARSSVVVAVDAYTHLACTYDGSTLTLWRDGVSDASVAYSGTYQDNNLSYFYIGADPDNPDRYYYNGAIDKVRIYKTVESPMFDEKTNNLLLGLDFDDNNIIVNDISNNNNHGHYNSASIGLIYLRDLMNIDNNLQ